MSQKKTSKDVQHSVKRKFIFRMDCNSENITDRDHFEFISEPYFTGNPLESVEMRYFRTVQDCTGLDHIKNYITKEVKIKSV
jgi:hypothetical protein